MYWKEYFRPKSNLLVGFKSKSIHNSGDAFFLSRVTSSLTSSSTGLLQRAFRIVLFISPITQFCKLPSQNFVKSNRTVQKNESFLNLKKLWERNVHPVVEWKRYTYNHIRLMFDITTQYRNTFPRSSLYIHTVFDWGLVFVVSYQSSWHIEFIFDIVKMVLTNLLIDWRDIIATRNIWLFTSITS